MIEQQLENKGKRLADGGTSILKESRWNAIWSTSIRTLSILIIHLTKVDEKIILEMPRYVLQSGVYGNLRLSVVNSFYVTIEYSNLSSYRLLYGVSQRSVLADNESYNSVNDSLSYSPISSVVKKTNRVASAQGSSLNRLRELY